MKGSCNCGKVSFEISGDVAALYQCHCKLCQKQSGSTSNTATIVNESDFIWGSGDLYCTTDTLISLAWLRIPFPRCEILNHALQVL